ncbi:MAG: coproporphyrinogen dehydrogenase HemZ [Firmicutes bacterium]|nr:coproporphyrinogen dehydrogenase HemZ [Bacillota bacterium]
MLVYFDAPGVWWNRGINLLRSLPEAQVVSADGEWDLKVSVQVRNDAMLLSAEDRKSKQTAIIPATRQDYLRGLFSLLERLLGQSPSPWGILTGVRPGKVAAKLLSSHGREETIDTLKAQYLLAPGKAQLVTSAVENGQQVLQPRGVSIYISVPFCPSRCNYCSFPGYIRHNWRHLLADYIDAVARELSDLLTGCAMYQLPVNSIYVGGGTPTSLSAGQLEQMLTPVSDYRGEFTIEAGRPDTLAPEFFSVMEQLGVTRVSINSQFPNQHTLDAIGRRHSVEEFYNVLELALNANIPVVNTDLIIGLPGQSPELFVSVLDQFIGLGVQNITLHALALKRGAKLSAQYLDQETAVSIAEAAYARLNESGYGPYYLYRQKNIAANLENIGFSLPGHYCYYNIASIAESEPVLGVGAGAVSKLVRHNSIETLNNPRDPKLYLERNQDLVRRKLDWLRHSS